MTARKVPNGKDFDSKTGLPTKPDLLLLSEKETVALAETASGRPNSIRHQSRGQAILRAAAGAVHDEYSATRGQPKTRFWCETHHGSRSKAVRKRLHHVHADRQHDSCPRRRSPRPARWCESVYGEQISCTPMCGFTKAKSRTRRKLTRRFGRREPRSRTPESLRGQLDSAISFRLYELIWKRTVACQMADAKKQTHQRHYRGRRRDIHRDRYQHFVRGLSCGLTSKAATIRKRNWRTKNASCPTSVKTNRSPATSMDPEEPYDSAAGAFHRSFFDANARRKRDRTTEYVCLDHRNDYR